MSIGAGIFLLALGAILAFGVRDSLNNIDLTVVGFVLMAAGGLGIALSYAITNRRRRVQTDTLDPAVEEEYRVVQEHRDIRE